jgi:flagellar secretion chaperone FliS
MTPLPARRAIGAYVQTGIETGVPEADPHKLVQMLFEGALAALADARLKLTGGDIPGRGKAISKAISIVDSGLRASLDLEKGGDLAARLDSLYEYICTRLFDANLRGQAQPLEEASSLLGELQEAWTGIRGAQREVAHA